MRHALKYTAKFVSLSRDPERLAALEKVFHRVRRVHSLGIRERLLKGKRWYKSYSGWKAASLNRLFREQGVPGRPNEITPEMVEHGHRRFREREVDECPPREGEEDYE
jgi:hypothetical protein